ncbi:MAG: lysylphosphatidylglycerol synthase transmembrane domain-containing protein, partial [Sphingobacterium sp.]
MYKKRIWTVSNNIFKVIITLIALYWVSTKISFNDLKEAFENCSPGYFLLGLLSYAISQIIASSRLNTFLQAIGLNVSERYNMRLYQLGLLYNFFLPGGIGGDGYKIYFLKKNHNIRGRKILSAVFFDRLSGLWALGIITGVLVMFMPRLEIPNTVTIACLVLGSATYLYVMHLFFRNFFKRFIETHI